MKPIVVPVNFTGSSSNAARYAADMALAVQGELHLIHVVQFPVTPAEIPTSDIMFEELQRNGETLLEALKKELTDRTNGYVPVSTHMDTGGVEYHLQKYCDRIKPFVVVMGASGNFLERMFAGSNTVRAVHHLPYPVLVIPDKAAFHAIRKIVLACDLDDIASGIPVSVSFLSELRDLFSAHFEVVNVITRSEQSEGQAVFEFDSWKDRLQEIYPEIHFVHTNKVDEGINDYLAGHPADLLLVFPKSHSLLEFHRSQAKKVVLHCPIPVMSLHE